MHQDDCSLHCNDTVMCTWSLSLQARKLQTKCTLLKGSFEQSVLKRFYQYKLKLTQIITSKTETNSEAFIPQANYTD
jgi:hypothetical protein